MPANQQLRVLLMLVALLGIVYVAIRMPGYFTSLSTVAALVGLEVAAVVVWHFQRLFFPSLCAVFLLAGTVSVSMNIVRWPALAAAALLGTAVYLRNEDHWFGAVHAIGLLCVVSAFASAVASSYPQTSGLKALSLLLLFTYAMTGARVIGRDPDRLLRHLLMGVEVMTALSFVSFFLFHFDFYGNPNSLGAIAGVVLVPLLLWSALNEPERKLRLRRQIFLALAITLLLASYARAGILAALLTSIVLCCAQRRFRALTLGIVTFLLLAISVSTLMPPLVQGEGPARGSFVDLFLFKGHNSQDVAASRRSVWRMTIESIHQNPFFGTGFGTSSDGRSPGDLLEEKIRPTSRVGVREHGNSYLALVEWMGLLGVLPFFTLLALVVYNLVRLFGYVRRTRDTGLPAVALAAVVFSGLIHAGFEDWLFSVGYYVSVFFWVIAFVFFDLLPAPIALRRPALKADPIISPRFASAES